MFIGGRKVSWGGRHLLGEIPKSVLHSGVVGGLIMIKYAEIPNGWLCFVNYMKTLLI